MINTRILREEWREVRKQQKQGATIGNMVIWSFALILAAGMMAILVHIGCSAIVWFK